ncbi:hypothetical protein HYQ46_009818 [Verticillium longisporum]|uniref:Secreted protein n=1 Tax=Verticillium dahliae (strain VdLs.17 / ATCC MYA-4575 / FGSC 10137) TaxID=498257 RepID=G2XFR3_VERDV|nr:uncharacterized protein VDAG_09187 [Verticillium dahliae VdLs.17]EGY18661.1 hypothetical protein VDAG_09187 [Verticillium dahliae VdLs.17]KAG7130836.1 hypothetical protein HYQ46_009818 [Verticillium longisporum]KAH6705868.1 hypothetical protein EV126DRAFT_379553 [Verticillium dahliae]
MLTVTVLSLLMLDLPTWATGRCICTAYLPLSQAQATCETTAPSELAKSLERSLSLTNILTESSLSHSRSSKCYRFPNFPRFTHSFILGHRRHSSSPHCSKTPISGLSIPTSLNWSAGTTSRYGDQTLFPDVAHGGYVEALYPLLKAEGSMRR